MRKQPKTTTKGISGLLACTMELFVLYKIEVVAAPIVRSELRYRAFSDGLLDWYFRLVGHQVWREIQIADKICQIFQKYYNSTCSSWKWWKRCQSCALNNARSHDLQKWHQQCSSGSLVFDISVIWISRQTGCPTNLKSTVKWPSLIPNPTPLRPPRGLKVLPSFSWGFSSYVRPLSQVLISWA